MPMIMDITITITIIIKGQAELRDKLILATVAAGTVAGAK